MNRKILSVVLGSMLVFCGTVSPVFADTTNNTSSDEAVVLTLENDIIGTIEVNNDEVQKIEVDSNEIATLEVNDNEVQKVETDINVVEVSETTQKSNIDVDLVLLLGVMGSMITAVFACLRIVKLEKKVKDLEEVTSKK